MALRIHPSHVHKLAMLAESGIKLHVYPWRMETLYRAIGAEEAETFLTPSLRDRIAAGTLTFGHGLTARYQDIGGFARSVPHNVRKLREMRRNGNVPVRYYVGDRTWVTVK